MSNSINPSFQTQHQLFDQNPNGDTQETLEWEAKARAWLSTMPEGKTVTMSEFEAWLDLNHASLPEEFKTMPRSLLYERVTSIQSSIEPSNEGKDANQVDLPQARFQRTDQWLPVYSCVAVMTRAYPENSGERKELVLLQNIASYLLLACGVLYVISGILCIGFLKRNRQKKEVTRDQAVKDLQELERRREELEALLIVERV